MIDIDKELIIKFQKGDLKSYNALVIRHLKNTIGFFYNITSNQMESEDLAQDVFIKLNKHLMKFNFQSKFTTYLYRVNMNTANTWFKRNRWRNLLHLDQTVEKGENDMLLEASWTRKELWNAVGKLPLKQRQVVMLRVAEELPYKEIGYVMGINFGTAKVHFHHAVNNLKGILK